MSKAKSKKAVSAVSRPTDQPPGPSPRASSPIDPPPEASPRQWILWSTSILLAGAALRFYQLGAAAFDHDEGVNGLFSLRLFRDGVYLYSPSEFHGPTLYYLSLAVTSFNRLLFNPAGVSETSLRWGIALVGLAAVWLILQLRPWMGAWGSAGAAALIAVSPGAVYYSRFFIHETLFVFFTFGVVVATLYYHQTADPIYLRLGAASAALLFATKETAFISVGVLGLACACTVGYMTWRQRGLKAGKARRAARESPPETRGAHLTTNHMIGAVVVFLVVYLAFYSSFGSNPRGILDSLLAFRFWAKFSVTEQLSDPFWAYFHALGREELPAVLLAILGFSFALYRARNRFQIFCGFWTLGILAAYTLIPYKTPWLTLNMIVPLTLVAGYGLAELCGFMNRGSVWRRVALGGLLAAALAFSAGQAINISFYHWDDTTIPYCSRRTLRSVVDLANRVKEIAKENGKGTASVINGTSEDMIFPLSWYLRDYTNMRFWEQLTPKQTDILIVRARQAQAVYSVLHDQFRMDGAYQLRPDVRVVLMIRLRR